MGTKKAKTMKANRDIAEKTAMKVLENDSQKSIQLSVPNETQNRMADCLEQVVTLIKESQTRSMLWMITDENKKAEYYQSLMDVELARLNAQKAEYKAREIAIGKISPPNTINVCSDDSPVTGESGTTLTDVASTPSSESFRGEAAEQLDMSPSHVDFLNGEEN
ncbi:MAG: hypothetical protein ACREBR_00915 [bacterium]